MSEIDADALAAPGDPERRVTWGPAFASMGLIGALICAVLLGLPSTLLDTSRPGGDLSTGAAIYAQAAQVVAFIVVPLIIAMQGGGGVARALWRLGVRAPDVNPLKWMALAVGAYLVLINLYSLLITPPEQDDIASLFGPVWVQVILIVLAAAASEEILFRGMLFGGLREGMPVWAAALISGLIFGALHGATGPSTIPPLTVFGIILALLYDKTGSILPGMLLHAVNNAVALLIQ